MKRIMTVLVIMAAAMVLAACGSKDSGSEKTVEPKTEAEFQGALKDFGISMYEGSEITGIKTGANSELYTFVPAEKGDAKAIMDHYVSEIENAFSGDSEWVKLMKSASSIQYRKGYSGWVFGVSMQKAGDKNGNKVTIVYGDNSVSY